MIRSKTLGPCVDTAGFAPAGLGVASGGGARPRRRIAARGRLELLTVNGDQLVAGAEHDVVSQPSGRPTAFRDSVFVPVARGVAVLDLASGNLRRIIALPRGRATSGSHRRGASSPHFRALGKVAVVDVTAPAQKPRLVTVAKGVAALGGGRLSSGDESVYAATLDGRVARLVPLTGQVVTARTIPALAGKTPAALEVSDVTFTSSGRKVTAVIHLTGGTLPAQSLVTKDARINLGSAALAMWEGGIVTKVGAKQGSALKITFKPQAGRLIVNAAAKRGAFTHLAVRLRSRPPLLVLAFTKAAPKQATPPSPPTSPTPRPRPRRPRLHLHLLPHLHRRPRQRRPSGRLSRYSSMRRTGVSRIVKLRRERGAARLCAAWTRARRRTRGVRVLPASRVRAPVGLDRRHPGRDASVLR